MTGFCRRGRQLCAATLRSRSRISKKAFSPKNVVASANPESTSWSISAADNEDTLKMSGRHANMVARRRKWTLASCTSASGGPLSSPSIRHQGGRHGKDETSRPGTIGWHKGGATTDRAGCSLQLRVRKRGGAAGSPVLATWRRDRAPQARFPLRNLECVPSEERHNAD